MRRFLGIAATAVGGVMAASCVTTPYDSAFNACESEANACYRVCEDIPDEQGYVRCQRHCDSDIDKCFAYAYEPYRSAYYGGSAYSSPWYGRYGQWYPSSGYYFSFDYYDRYGYRAQRRPGGYGYDGRRYDDRRYDDRRRGDGRRDDGRRDDGRRDDWRRGDGRDRDGGYGRGGGRGNGGGGSGGATPPQGGGSPPSRPPRYTPPPSGGSGAPPQPNYTPPPQQPNYTPPPQQPSYTPPPSAEPPPAEAPQPRAPRGRPPEWKRPGGAAAGSDGTEE